MDSPMHNDQPVIKKEPQDNTTSTHNLPDHINLISDDENETMTAPSKDHAPTVNIGTSLLQASSKALTKAIPAPKATDPKPTTTDLNQKLRERQKELAAKLKKQQASKQTPAPQILGAASNATSPLFVSQRTGENTPAAETTEPPEVDPGKQFAALQRHVLKKRLNNTLTTEEEVMFLRAENEEKARLQRERLEQELDMIDTPGPDEEASENDFIIDAPDFEMSDEEPEEPKKTSRKRKPAAEKPAAAPKKRGRPPKATKAAQSGDKDILEQVREHQAAKKTQKKKTGKAVTGKGKAKATKSDGPTMLNQESIMGSNVFKDTEMTRGLGDQPTFEGATWRSDALKQLIADIPAENRKLANADKRYLEKAIQSFTGQRSVKPASDGNWSVNGMKVTLKHYQVLGTAFMRQRENSSSEPKGGILADEMGLGKTIMMLANIMNGKALVGRKKVKTTLIVASPALIAQWRREIAEKIYTRKEDRIHGVGRVKEFSAAAQLRSNEEIEELEECDIVLTTWGMVNKSFPKTDIPTHLVTPESKAQWWKEHWDRERGVLHRIKFLRVILDEAQQIKNHRSLTSQACRAIEATHHWAISGTPIQNNVKEFYPYFKFIREPSAGSYKIFKNNFASPDDPDGTERLGIYLRKFMIRRTHLDTYLGAKLLDLPQPKQHTLELEFNDIERAVYDIVRNRFIQRVNRLSRDGELERGYNHVWVMLLRLRQLCAHIALIQGTIMDLLEWDDFERLSSIGYEKEDENSENCENLLRHLIEKVKEHKRAPGLDGKHANTIFTKSETTAAQVADAEGVEGNIGHSHGQSYKFGRYLDSLRKGEAWSEIVSRTLCSACRQQPRQAHLTSCGHIYCLACLSDLQHRSARLGREFSRCSECGQDYTHATPCQSEIDRFASVGMSDDGDLLSKKGKKSKAGDYERWVDMKGDVLPSAKTVAVKAQVLDWIAEDDSVKIIIYSQFIPMLHLLGRICRTERWSYEKYTGNMSHESRDKALASFCDPNGNVRILLASLKAGGLGLNLTAANRVITLDPWYNESVEQQAFCRVFRIGQQKETRMLRLIVKNTIDEAIIALQERKQVEIDAVMDDSKRKEKLSVQDLMRLFGGNVGEDGEGRPFIIAEEAGSGVVGPEQSVPADASTDDEGDMMGNEE